MEPFHYSASDNYPWIVSNMRLTDGYVNLFKLISTDLAISRNLHCFLSCGGGNPKFNQPIRVVCHVYPLLILYASHTNYQWLTCAALHNSYYAHADCLYINVLYIIVHVTTHVPLKHALFPERYAKWLLTYLNLTNIWKAANASPLSRFTCSHLICSHLIWFSTLLNWHTLINNSVL